MVINPTTGIDRQAAIDSQSLAIASADHPCLLSSPEVFTCRQTEGGSAIASAASFSALKSLSESTA